MERELCQEEVDGAAAQDVREHGKMEKLRLFGFPLLLKTKYSTLVSN
jgi:hypothetical protein